MLGGGHAHVGGMIYLGDNWPDSYRNTLFTCNIHGHRVNNDRLDRSEEGYQIVARHNPDFLSSADPWFRGLELKYGPDGGVYLTDWSDIGECHETDSDNAHRENGRIFKITYGDVRPVTVDLGRQTDEELARLQVHPNEWYVRMARRLLQERAAAGKDLAAAHRVLREILATHPDARRKLRAIWALNATGGLDEKARLALVDNPSPQVRAWGVRLLVDDGAPSAAAVNRLGEMAGFSTSSNGQAAERSALVRLALASALQRVPLADRWPMAEALTLDGGYATSREHTLLLWYGLEPLVAARSRAGGRAARTMPEPAPLPVPRTAAGRRRCRGRTGRPGADAPGAGRSRTPPFHRDVLDGILDACQGRKRVGMPEGWAPAFAWLTERGDPDVQAKAAALGLLFGDPKAEAGLRAVVEDRAGSPGARQFALQNLVDRRAAELVPVLFRLLDDPAPAPRSVRWPPTTTRRRPNRSSAAIRPSRRPSATTRSPRWRRDRPGPWRCWMPSARARFPAAT